jgi:hypothetical protein
LLFIGKIGLNESANLDIQDLRLSFYSALIDRVPLFECGSRFQVGEIGSQVWFQRNPCSLASRINGTFH